MNTAMNMIDNLRDTCESHSRCNVVEVMGRDVSVVSSHPDMLGENVRAIVDSESVGLTGESVRFDLKCGKVLLFDKETERRVSATLSALREKEAR